MAPPRRSACLAAVWLGTGTILSIAGCAEMPPPINTAGHRCPSWWDFPRSSQTNADSPYLGCVSASNLRAMLADPADLTRGRPLGPTDANRQALAIENYQQGKVKPLQGSGSMSPSSSGSSSGGGQ